MARARLMLEPDDVRERARVSFDRNWRNWASQRFAGEPSGPDLGISLHPPREQDLGTRERVAAARGWAAHWRACTLPGIGWQMRSWPRIGDQELPVQVRMSDAEQVALWAGCEELWRTALERVAQLRECLLADWRHALQGTGTEWPRTPSAPAADGTEPLLATASPAVKASIGEWCKLDGQDWEMALEAWDWLFAHPYESCYVRQLPIRGIHTKWIESHGKALQPLHAALTGGDFAFAQVSGLFRCKACCPQMQLAGCDEYALSASQLARITTRPDIVVICENLVNVLCLDNLAGTLALHGTGRAVTNLKTVPWLTRTRLVYWGDLDSNGFAILNSLRGFAPHARSAMMNTRTLSRHFDLCVEEPKPATGPFDRLTPEERDALDALAQGDPTRSIANLRLEQERIEWDWAYDELQQSIQAIS